MEGGKREKVGFFWKAFNEEVGENGGKG